MRAVLFSKIAKKAKAGLALRLSSELPMRLPCKSKKLFATKLRHRM